MLKTYRLMRKARGRVSQEDMGSLPKMRDRLKQLRKSTRCGVCGQRHRKYKVEYWLEEII